eukprot:scaffold697_cov235-Pinguiococcus_pyrenoidosus.AAC.9
MSRRVDMTSSRCMSASEEGLRRWKSSPSMAVANQFGSQITSATRLFPSRLPGPEASLLSMMSPVLSAYTRSSSRTASRRSSTTLPSCPRTALRALAAS